MNRQEYFFESLIEKFKKHSYTIFCFMKDLINKIFFCCKKVRAAGPLSLFSHSWEFIRCKWDWQSSGQRNKLTSMLTLGWTLARPIHFCSQSTGSSKDWDYNKAGKKKMSYFLFLTVDSARRVFFVVGEHSLHLVMLLWRCGMHRV